MPLFVVFYRASGLQNLIKSDILNKCNEILCTECYNQCSFALKNTLHPIHHGYFRIHHTVSITIERNRRIFMPHNFR